MKLNLIQKEDEKHAEEKLANYYTGDLIPAEKKKYLTRLKASHGPYMGIESSGDKPHYLMDAASQIATLGLGFNSSVFMGPAHYLESWTNQKHTETVNSLREAFHSFIKRKIGWSEVYTTFCNSGAEANEIALGYCYRSRKNHGSKKVLAFEGSFHGRMLVSLQATWNPSKREPFLFPGFECSFVPFPELPGDVIDLPFPKNWRETWDQATAKDFKAPEEWANDPQLKTEVDCLLKVRDQLKTGEVFSIIVEPMQCEGGDRYGSDRYHTALLLMARSFGVKVIHDEVQTGFHLGRQFFWHRMLDLKDLNGEQLSPNYVVCAKKAQIGMVICETNENLINAAPEEYSVASMIRGYHHAVALDQSQAHIIALENKCRERLDVLINKHSNHISRPRLKGMSFAFDLKDKTKVMDFIGARFDHGLLYYPAGEKTLRFRLNTAFMEKDIDFLFERLDQLIIQVLEGGKASFVDNVETVFRTPDNLYLWNELLLEKRLDSLFNLNNLDSKTCLMKCGQILTSDQGVEGSTLVELTKENINKYSNQIEAIQKETYEASRQTPLKTFQAAVEDENAVSLLLVVDNKIEAMAISGSISHFPNERILRRDPDFNDPHVLYMIDCTVRPGHQGKGLGRQMKSALNLMAMAKGKTKIVGRNRDRMAGAMLSINLGLGSREQFYVEEDYPDNEEFRDVFYYRNDLTWEMPKARLDDSIQCPLSPEQLDTEYLKEQLPFINNKVCLSNFVSLRYLDHLKELFAHLPKELRHGYSASGQSECVDKISKSMFVADSKRHKMVSFKGHYFGIGSFMSRSLSIFCDTYFPVDHYNSPNEQNWKDVLKELKENTNPDEVLGIWIEPLPQNTLHPVPIEFLKELRKWTRENKINLIYNETASSSYRYSLDKFCVSSFPEITPDAGFIFMGGQAGLVYTNEENFLAKPLMMISTWDGDEFSYATYTKALDHIQNDIDEYKKVVKLFGEKLKEELTKHNIEDFFFHNGVGTVRGDIPYSLSQLMTPLGCGTYKFCPSYGAMKKFNEGVL